MAEGGVELALVLPLVCRVEDLCGYAGALSGGLQGGNGSTSSTSEVSFRVIKAASSEAAPSQ